MPTIDQPSDAHVLNLVYGNAGSPAGGGATPSANFLGIDTSQLLAQLGALSKQESGSDGVTNSNGAPLLPTTAKMTVSQMMLALTALNSKISQNQSENAMDGIKVDQGKLDKAAADTTQKLKDWIKSSEDAAAAEKKQKTSSWISKIFGAIASVVSFVVAAVALVSAVAATIATGGAGLPLLALAVVGVIAAGAALVDTACDITNSVRAGMDPPKEPLAFGPSAAIATAASNAAYNNAIKDGKSEEEAQQAKAAKYSAVYMGMSITFSVVAIAASMGAASASAATAASTTAEAGVEMATLGGSVAGAGAGAGATVASTAGSFTGLGMTTAQLTQLTKTASTWINVLAGLTKAGADIGVGVYGLQASEDQYDAATARVESKRIEATTAEISAHLQALQDEIKKILEDMQEALKACSDIVSSESTTYQQISGNLGGGSV